jgi:hypothetical protein
MTGGSHALELFKVAPVFLTVVLIRTAVSKGEHSYGWSSASGGTCKAIKDRLRFCSGQHFNVDQVLLATYD